VRSQRCARLNGTDRRQTRIVSTSVPTASLPSAGIDSDRGTFAMRNAPGGTGALASSRRACILASFLLPASVEPAADSCVRCAAVRACPLADWPACWEPHPAASTHTAAPTAATW
jgi:hypothetical protein